MYWPSRFSVLFCTFRKNSAVMFAATSVAGDAPWLGFDQSTYVTDLLAMPCDTHFCQAK